jgi:hypothetical protein
LAGQPLIYPPPLPVFRLPLILIQIPTTTTTTTIMYANKSYTYPSSENNSFFHFFFLVSWWVSTPFGSFSGAAGIFTLRRRREKHESAKENEN